MTEAEISGLLAARHRSDRVTGGKLCVVPDHRAGALRGIQSRVLWMLRPVDRSIRSCDSDRQVAGLQILAAILNRFTAIGTPQTQRVA